MTAVKASDVDRLSRSPPPGISLLLFYGPDLGRSTERAKSAADARDTDLHNPLEIIKLSGEEVVDHPGRLAEEAMSLSLFGSRRLIWIRPTSRNLVPAVTACLEAGPSETLIIVEAGDLPKTSSLRVLCERSPRALAMPSFVDEQRDLNAILDDALASHGLTIDPDARELLFDSLGANRLASRSELAKLALYVHGRDRITRMDILAVVSDVSGFGIDDAIDAAFTGDAEELEARIAQLTQTGTSPAAILSAGSRHAMALMSRRHSVDGGEDPTTVVRTWRGLHFRRHATIQAQLRRWPQASLNRAIASLEEATLATRRSPQLASTLAARAFLRLASRQLA